MVALSNFELQQVIDAANKVPQEERDVFLQRLDGLLRLRGRNDMDAALIEAARGTHQPT